MASLEDFKFTMTITGEYEFQVEKAFNVLRFGWDPTGFDNFGFFSDSTRAHFEQDASGASRAVQALQDVCTLIVGNRTMHFVKNSDLVTVKLVEAFLQKQKLASAFFKVNKMHKGRVGPEVDAIEMQKVSIVNLRTRYLDPHIARIGYYPIDVVTLKADEMSFPFLHQHRHGTDD